MSEYDHIVVKGNKSAYLRALNKGCSARFTFKVVEMSEETRRRIVAGADCGIHDKNIVDGKTLVQWCYQHVAHHMDMVYGRRFDTKTLEPYKYISVSTASIWRGERRK